MADQSFRITYGDIEPAAENFEGGGLLTIGTTASELTFTRSPIRAILLASPSNNGGTIYIGGPDVASDGSNAFILLDPGEKIGLGYNDVSVAMYAVASIANQKMTKGALY